MAKTKVKRTLTDMGIERRTWNGRTIVLLEDRHKEMMKPDGTSYQYIIAVENISDKGNTSLAQKRFITDLCNRREWQNAKHAAKDIFLEPEKYPEIIGSSWGK